jgi:molybdopterin synthase sulfur carrier subunit
MSDDTSRSAGAGGDAAATKELELRFFATFREAVGQKELRRAFEVDATVGGVLEGIETEFPELGGELLDADGEIQPQLSVLKNGREVVHLDGPETELADGDRVSVFPPVAGG